MELLRRRSKGAAWYWKQCNVVQGGFLQLLCTRALSKDGRLSEVKTRPSRWRLLRCPSAVVYGL
eukprot:240832-Chlamydomonas_euryale.AAC.1